LDGLDRADGGRAPEVVARCALAGWRASGGPRARPRTGDREGSERDRRARGPRSAAAERRSRQLRVHAASASRETALYAELIGDRAVGPWPVRGAPRTRQRHTVKRMPREAAS